MVETTHLGKSSALPASPDEAALDYVSNPRPGALYLVRFAAPEFTSLRARRGQIGGVARAEDPCPVRYRPRASADGITPDGGGLPIA